MRLKGKRAVIAGASGKDNIGQAIARRFVAEGADILIAGRRLENLEALTSEIGGHASHFDIERDGAAEDLMDEAMEKMGGIDIVVQSVGASLPGPFLETSRSDLEKMTRLQLIGPYQYFQAALKRMADGGSIINVSSVGAFRVNQGQAIYSATKAGIDHLVRVLANEFGARGIRINTLSPGLVDTPMARPFMDNQQFLEAHIRYYPLGRIGTGDECGAAAAYLASDECFMTGENLQVSGGLPLRMLPSADEMEAAFEDVMSAQ